MIPKKIHYCWFGCGEKPKLAKKCIASWKKYCPDYEIIEWNEDNFDLDYNSFTRYCYDNRKWAFLSDFARLLVVAEHGGVYFDTDVELLKRPDELLQYEAFYGFENDHNIATGLGFGAEAKHPTIMAMKGKYEAIVPNADGSYPMIVCPALNTEALMPFGLRLDGTRQNIAGAEILPADWLNPYDDPTGRLNKTNNSVSVHWYSKSWMSKGKIIRSILTKPLHRIFGVDAFKRLRR
ncbi:MAG: glycosyl transferase [Oscillospiraceae bacterium]|nr:glycosyl transferase [Oscillospiraceae bacterium]